MSENDKTSDLKPALQRLGCSDVKLDHTARTKIGGNLKPDLQFHLDGKYYVVEAKTEPVSLGSAVEKASKCLRELMEPVEIAFAVLWLNNGKSKASYISSDGQKGMRTFSAVEELAEWIVSSCKTKRVSAPVNESGLLDVLNQLVERFYQHYKKVPLDDIQSLFGGKSFFETVLSEKGEKEEEVQSLRKVSAFLLVNQMFFYGILAKRTGKYQEINPEKAKNPAYLQQLFDKVLEDDYAPVFGVPVLSLSDDKALGSDLVFCANAISQLLKTELSHDILGKVFHKLIPLKLRKIVAAYYTNSQAGDLLASLAVENEDDKVFDPACGSGTLLISSYHRKKALLAAKKNFDDAAVHKKFLTKDIFGSDIMPFAGHLAAINLTLQKPETFLNSLNILIEDSIGLMPGEKVEPAEEKLTEAFKQTLLHEFAGEAPIKSRKVLKGAVTLKRKRASAVTLPKFDVIIMNPPFTRFQRLSPEYKKDLKEHIREPVYKKMIHGQLGLQGYFMLLADRFLKEEGRIAAVLPITTFTLKGFFEIIKYFFSHYEVEYIIACTGRSAFSENTSLREVLFVAKKTRPRDNTSANICFISQSPTDMSEPSVIHLAKKLKSIKNAELEDDEVFSHRLLQKSVVEDPRRLAYLLNLPMKDLQEFDYMFEEKAISSQKFSKGKNIFESLNWGVFENERGVDEVGYYALSILPPDLMIAKDHDMWAFERETSDSIYVKNRKTNNQFRIPKSSIMPQFRRFSGQKIITLDPPKQFVVINTFSELPKFLSETGTLENKTKSISKSLANLELKKYFKEGSGNAFLFYRGNLSAANTDLLFISSKEETFAGPGGSWVMKIDKKALPLMTVYFNSSFFLLEILKERKETEGAFIEVDKYALENVYIPDPQKISDAEFARIEKLYNVIKSKEWPQLVVQLEEHFESRTLIDTEIARLLGISEAKSEKLIKNLQSSLVQYINILKSTMGGK